MDFEEVLDQAIAMLQRRRKVSYSALKQQFGLDDEYLADLKVELIVWYKFGSKGDGTLWLSKQSR